MSSFVMLMTIWAVDRRLRPVHLGGHGGSCCTGEVMKKIMRMDLLTGRHATVGRFPRREYWLVQMRVGGILDGEGYEVLSDLVPNRPLHATQMASSVSQEYQAVALEMAAVEYADYSLYHLSKDQYDEIVAEDRADVVSFEDD